MVKAQSIKYQFLLPFQIFLALGLTIIGVAAFSITENAVIDSALLTMKNRLEQVIVQTENFHRKAQSDLSLAMENPLFQEYFALPDTMAGNRYNGEKVIQFTPAQRALKERLDQWTLVLQKRFPIVETCLIDRHGQEHARITRGEIAPDDDFSSEENGAPFFEPTFKLQAGEVHVAAPYMSPDASEWVFAYTSPVVMADGSKPGLYHYEIPLAKLQEVLHGGGEPGQSRLLIVDPSGLIVADTTQKIDLTLKAPSDEHSHGEDEEYRLVDYLPPLSRVSQDPALARMLARMKNGQGGWDTFREGETLYYATHLPMPTFGWSVLHIKPYDALLEGDHSLSQIKQWIFAISLGLFLLAGGMTWMVANRVTRPIREILAVVAEMTQGDMTRRIGLPATRNEVFDMAEGINGMADALARNIRMIHLHAGSVTAFIKEILKIRKVFDEQEIKLRENARGAATENRLLDREVTRIHGAITQMMTATASADNSSRHLAQQIAEIADSAGAVNQDVATVAASTEAIDHQLSTMSRHLEESKGAVDRVAESVHRMTGSLEEIRTLTERSTRESAQAHQLADETREGMSRLSHAAAEIGSVVEMINGISEQTNMLSLNAAIEAASAGAFGKGFAVVANEVKELAKQTGEATQLIADRVWEIQEMTKAMVTKVGAVGGNIQHLHDGNQEISRQVIAQTGETRQIAGAVSALAHGADELAASSRRLEDVLGAAASAATNAASRTSEIAHAIAAASGDSVNLADQNTAISALAVEIQDAVDKTRAASELVLGMMESSLSHSEYLKGLIAHFQALGDVARQISGDLFNSQTGVDIGLEPFNVRRMKEIHLNLMGQLEKTLFGRGEMDAGEVGQAEKCPIGLVLATDELQRLRNSPIYARIQQIHGENHRVAAEIIHLVNAGHPRQAESTLAQFRTSQEELFAQLNLLYLSQETLQKSERYVSWNAARHDTGLATLNTFHLEMVDHMNRIYLAVRDQAGDQMVARGLDNLLAFCEKQFAWEKSAMAQQGYSNRHAHEKEHDFFLWKTLDIISQYHEDEFSIHWDLLHFLNVWLVRHAENADHPLGGFLARQSVRQ